LSYSLLHNSFQPLKTCDWAGVYTVEVVCNREQVGRLMHGTPDGAFLVRDASDRVKDSYTLTLR